MSKNNERSILKNEDPPMKLRDDYIETRSRRVQLLMQPSLHQTIRNYAEDENTSINDIIHKVLEHYFKD